MSNGQTSWTVYLPLQTTVYIYGYTNAAYAQQIVVTDENGVTVLKMTGTGESNTPTTPPSWTYQTPKTSKNPNKGFGLTVQVFTQQNGPVASQIMGGGANLAYASTYLITSEDSMDADWNDAVLNFLWYPGAGDAALSAGQESLDEAEAGVPS
jgi:hypothetical protein